MLDLAWDGGWYRRAYFDDGTPLGSVQNEECRLDSLTQSWAVLSGAANRQRAERAMDAVRAHLVRRDAQIVLLLTPPFDRMEHDPGYIKGYLPGVRENGGQYTHAALWTVIALARLGLGDEAMELFHMINPINHARTPEGVERYRVEPYAVAADVYAHPMHVGRGGWTWYTGSAGWMYQAAVGSLLGLRRQGDTFRVDPCIPAMWPAYSLDWQHGGAAITSRCRIPDTSTAAFGPRHSMASASTLAPSRSATTADATRSWSCLALPRTRGPRSPRRNEAGRSVRSGVHPPDTAPRIHPRSDRPHLPTAGEGQPGQWSKQHRHSNETRGTLVPTILRTSC